MYLHRKHIHPSVLAVMEHEGHKQVNVPASVRKAVSCKVIGESLVLEGYTPTGKKLVVEGDQIDPVLGGKPLIIPINENYGFVLGADDTYEVMRIDEGLGSMISTVGNWIKNGWNALMGKLKKIFTKPGEAEQFEAMYKQDPTKALKHLTDRAVASGKTPEQAATMAKQFQKSYTTKVAAEKGIKNKDAEMLHAMSGVAGAQSPEEKAAAQQKLDRAHELALAKAQKGQTVVQGGSGSTAPAKTAPEVKKPAPAQNPAATTEPAPAPAPAPAVDTPAPAAAPAAPAAPAGPKEGDKVEKTDAAGKKIEGQVITVDEAGAKKWNEQFAGKSGFIGIKAGPVVKTSNGFVPLDKEWQVAAAPDPAAPAPAAKPAAPAATPPAPAPAAAATPPEVKPVPAADGSAPTNVPPAAAPPKPADTGLTGAEQGPGPAAAAPAPDQDQAGQPAAEPAFDPNATMAAPPQQKRGVPAGMKKSKIVNGKRVVGERLMTMAEINRLLKGTK